jgi:hypothetical protein
MKSRKLLYWILMITAAMFVLTACGGNQLTYQVTGTADQAEVIYMDSDGISQTETVALPWEISFNAGSSGDFSLSAQSTTGKDGVGCIVLLDDDELGRADAMQYAGCSGSFEKSGGSLSTNFSSARDVLPDGSSALLQEVEEAAPEESTEAPEEASVTPPDLAADFVAYSNEEGTLFLRYPPNWNVQVIRSGVISVVSDTETADAVFQENDFSQPLGFLLGQVVPVSDYKSSDPGGVLAEWEVDVEEDMGLEPISEMTTAPGMAWRDYTGENSGSFLHFTTLAIVNGGNTAVFLAGRTGSAAEELGVLRQKKMLL